MGTIIDDCVTALTPYLNGRDLFSAEDVARAMCAQFADSEYTTGAIESLQGSLTDTNNGLNTLYLLSTGALVFIMHGGFAMLCAGSVRSKNALNILLQTILDACVSAFSWYLVGWAFAYGVGGTPNGFIGNAQFGMYRWSTGGSASPEALQAFNPAGTPWGYHMWFFQWAFAATATTIPAGCVAERFNFNAYLGYSFFLSAFVYPVVAHWVWCPEGWLNYVRTSDHNTYLVESGYIDFAGSSVVHMVGGFSGMMGCILVGPRMGRFDSSGKPVDMPGHSATLVVLGTVLLWFGWYGFNPGSQLFLNNSLYAAVAGRAAVVTTLGGAAGGLATLVNGFLHSKAWDLVACCNGTLVGFVVITAGCHVVEPWAAMGYCFIAGFIFDGVVWLFLKLKIDDPLCAAPMHGFTGWWGVLMVGCLAKKEYIFQSYIGDQVMYQQPEDTWVKSGYNDNAGIFCGAFYPGCGGRLLAAQVIGSLTILGWVCFLMGLFFFIFKLLGKLRISPEDEQAGLDVSKHGGSAYNYDHGLGKPDKAHVSAA